VQQLTDGPAYSLSSRRDAAGGGESETLLSLLAFGKSSQTAGRPTREHPRSPFVRELTDSVLLLSWKIRIEPLGACD